MTFHEVILLYVLGKPSLLLWVGIGSLLPEALFVYIPQVCVCVCVCVYVCTITSSVRLFEAIEWNVKKHGLQSQTGSNENPASLLTSRV